MATINGKSVEFPADLTGISRILKAYSNGVRKVVLSDREKSLLHLITRGNTSGAEIAKQLLAKTGAV